MFGLDLALFSVDCLFFLEASELDCCLMDSGTNAMLDWYCLKTCHTETYPTAASTWKRCLPGHTSVLWMPQSSAILYQAIRCFPCGNCLSSVKPLSQTVMTCRQRGPSPYAPVGLDIQRKTGGPSPPLSTLGPTLNAAPVTRLKPIPWREIEAGRRDRHVLVRHKDMPQNLKGWEMQPGS